MSQIKRVSSFFYILFIALFFAAPIILLLGWFYAPDTLVLLHGLLQFDAIPASYRGMHHYPDHSHMAKGILHPLTTNEKFLGFLLSTVPTAINMFVLYSLSKLFNLYKKGEIFSLLHVVYMRRIGYALLAGQLIQPFYQFAMGMVLTLGNPPGMRYASITMDHTNLGMILTALMVILISSITAEGYKLQQEQQLTI